MNFSVPSNDSRQQSSIKGTESKAESMNLGADLTGKSERIVGTAINSTDNINKIKPRSNSQGSIDTIGRCKTRKNSTMSTESTGTIKPSTDSRNPTQNSALEAFIADTNHAITEIASDEDSDEYDVSEYGTVDAIVPRRSFQYTHAVYKLESPSDSREPSIRRLSVASSLSPSIGQRTPALYRRESMTSESRAESISGVSLQPSIDDPEITDSGLRKFRHTVYPLKPKAPKLIEEEDIKLNPKISRLVEDEKTFENSETHVSFKSASSVVVKMPDFTTSSNEFKLIQAEPQVVKEEAVVVVMPRESYDHQVYAGNVIPQYSNEQRLRIFGWSIVTVLLITAGLIIALFLIDPKK